MRYLIEYYRRCYDGNDEHKYEIIYGWTEIDALLNFYEQHCNTGRHPADYRTYERDLLLKKMKPLNIDECIYVLNDILAGCLVITGVYENFEFVYVTEEEESDE